MVKYIGLLFISITLFSCEGITNHEVIILNNSSFDANVHIVSDFAYTEDTMVENHSKISVLYWDQLGGNENSLEPYELIDSLLIYNISDTLEKDFRDNENWIISTNKRGIGNYKHTYTLEIECLFE